MVECLGAADAGIERIDKRLPVRNAQRATEPHGRMFSPDPVPGKNRQPKVGDDRRGDESKSVLLALTMQPVHAGGIAANGDALAPVNAATALIAKAAPPGGVGDQVEMIDVVHEKGRGDTLDMPRMGRTPCRALRHPPGDDVNKAGFSEMFHTGQKAPLSIGEAGKTIPQRLVPGVAIPAGSAEVILFKPDSGKPTIHFDSPSFFFFFAFCGDQNDMAQRSRQRGQSRMS